MGEYAIRKNDKREIKIGTCESMYYLRYEDKDKVTCQEGSLDPSTELDLFWRLPFPDEDNVQPGEYQKYNRGEPLYKNGVYGAEYFSDPTTAKSPGIMQLKDEASGLLVNVACYQGEKLPAGNADFKPFWNGKGNAYELAFVKNTKAGVLPVVRCKFCGQMWRYSWEEILPFVNGELKNRLAKYAMAESVSDFQGAV